MQHLQEQIELLEAMVKQSFGKSVDPGAETQELDPVGDARNMTDVDDSSKYHNLIKMLKIFGSPERTHEITSVEDALEILEDMKYFVNVIKKAFPIIHKRYKELQQLEADRKARLDREAQSMEWKTEWKTKMQENYRKKVKNILYLKESGYEGNCVDAPEVFGSEEDAVQWMIQTLAQDENVIRIPKEIFFKYIPTSDVPKEALIGKDPEYYYIIDGRGYANTKTSIDFVLYSVNKNGHDIHYFFSSEYPSNIIEEIKPYQINEPGYGAGSGMSNA